MGKNIVPSVAGISDAGKIMNEIAFKGADVNLKDLANQIQTFLRNDGFVKTKIEDDGYGNYFDVQGIKSGWWRTISSSRKAIHVIIEGAPNRFTVNVGVGEWGKNIGVASLTAISTMGIGLIFQGAGIGSNILFERKLNKFIHSAVFHLKENTLVKYIPEKKPRKQKRARKQRGLVDYARRKVIQYDFIPNTIFTMPKGGKSKTVKKRKPKTPKPKTVEDYDLGPLLYCPNVACRSEHLQTKANGKKYCTKCGWNK